MSRRWRNFARPSKSIPRTNLPFSGFKTRFRLCHSPRLRCPVLPCPDGRQRITAPGSGPTSLRREFHFKGMSRNLLEQVTSLYGLKAIFDDSAQSRPVRMDLETLTFSPRFAKRQSSRMFSGCRFHRTRSYSSTTRKRCAASSSAWWHALSTSTTPPPHKMSTMS